MTIILNVRITAHEKHADYYILHLKYIDYLTNKLHYDFLKKTSLNDSELEDKEIKFLEEKIEQQKIDLKNLNNVIEYYEKKYKTK